MSLDFWLGVPACDCCGRGPERVFDDNYTGNVVPMWQLAGCYSALYESDGKRASDIVETLCTAARYMRDNPELFRPLNPSNGWGSYSGALRFLGRVAAACKKWPDATVGVYR